MYMALFPTPAQIDPCFATTLLIKEDLFTPSPTRRHFPSASALYVQPLGHFCTGPNSLVVAGVGELVGTVLLVGATLHIYGFLLTHGRLYQSPFDTSMTAQ